jgi:hypothetical protein
MKGAPGAQQTPRPIAECSRPLPGVVRPFVALISLLNSMLCGHKKVVPGLLFLTFPHLQPIDGLSTEAPVVRQVAAFILLIFKGIVQLLARFEGDGDRIRGVAEPV